MTARHFWVGTTLIVTVFIFAALFLEDEAGSQVTGVPDLSEWYGPVEDAYLDGWNHEIDGRSVLWFDAQRRGWWRQMNSLPGEDCHFDRLRWTRKHLKYRKTVHSCEGPTHETVYQPSITFLPREWDGGDWSKGGSSTATQKLDGDVVCEGVNNWTATVVGWVDHPDYGLVVEWRTVQSTDWTSGWCSDTEWSETYWMTAEGLQGTEGGNGSTFKWDIDFFGWLPR